MQEEKFRYRVGPDLGARIALLTINAIFIIIWWVFYLVKEFGEARHEVAPVYAGFHTKTDAYVFYNMNKKILFYLPTTYENADKLFKEMELHYEQKRKAQRCK